jgi:hypothetical protein
MKRSKLDAQQLHGIEKQIIIEILEDAQHQKEIMLVFYDKQLIFCEH